MSDSFLPPVVVELSGSDDGFAKAITRAVTSLERLGQAAEASAATVEGAFVSLAASFESLVPATESVTAAKVQMQGFARAARSVATATDKAATTTDAAMASIAESAERMGEAVTTAAATAETGIATIGAEAKATAAGMKTTSDEAVVAGTRLRGAGAEAEGLGGKLLGLDTVFSKIGKWGTVSLAAIGIASTVLASHFQTEMTRLSTAAGAPIATVQAMRGQVLQTADAVGVSGTEMAEALYHPVSAGLDMATSLQTVKYAAEEAKISGASLEDTTYSLSSVMKAFNEPASQAQQTIASLNAIVGQGDMRFQDFNESVKNWAPTAAQMGISINSMGAGLAYLTDRGNSAEVAATRMTMGISMMTTPSKQAAKLLEGLGVASSDVSASSKAFQNVMQDTGITQNKLAADLKKPDGLYVALSDLKSGLEKTGVSGSEADSVLSKIFGGGRSDKAIMSLMQNLDGLRTKFQDIQKASNTKSFDKAWQQTQQTFSAQMEKLKAAAENAGISLGTVLLPAVTRLVGGIAKGVGVIAPFVSQHQQLIGLLASVAGGLLLAAAAVKTVTMVTELWEAAQIALDAAMDANPIGLIVIAIAGLVAGIIYAWNHFAIFREVVTATFDAVVAAAEYVWHAMVASFDGIVSAAEATWHGLQAAWNAVSSGVKWLWHQIEGAWDAVWSVTSTVWNAISGFFRKWWPLLLVIFATPIAVLIAAWNHFHTAVFDTAKKVWNAIYNFFAGIWSGISSAASSAWSAIEKYVIAPNEALWRALESLWHTVSNWLGSQWHAIGAVAGAAWAEIRKAMIDPIEQAWHSISNWIGRISSSISSGLHGAWNAVRNIGSQFVQIGSAIVHGIINGVEGAGSTLYDSLKNLANNALSSAKSFLGINSPSRLFADMVGQYIPQGLAMGIQAGTHHAVTATRAMGAAVASAGTGAGGLALARAGGGTVHNHYQININPQGHVLTDQNLRDLLRQEMLRLGARNSMTWQPYKR